MFHPALLLALSLSIQPAAGPVCLPDDSMVQMRGTIKEVLNRDRHTGNAYSYFIIDTDKPYCLAGDNVDERSSMPTAAITLIPHDYDKSRQEFGPLVGRAVVMTGKLSSSNGGGPQLFYKTVARITRDW